MPTVSKRILYNEQARRKLQKGVNIISDAVRVTLGAKGKNVLIEGHHGAPQVTNDGVTIARAINVKDRVENVGVEVIKGVANNTNNDAGDGTTTATILAQAIINEGLRNVAAGTNPRALKRGIDKCTELCVEELEKMSEKVHDQIESIATISADDSEMGKIIAELIEEVGADGAITVENDQSFGLTKEVVKGSQIESGYVSPFMITDDFRQEAKLNKPLVFVTDFVITSAQDMIRIMTIAAKDSGRKELIIIAEEISGDAVATALLNKARGTFTLLAVNAPGYTDDKTQILEDLAAFVGAKFVSKDAGHKLEQITKEVFGTAEKVIASKDRTVIINGGGSKKGITKRINEVKQFIKDAKEENNDTERFQERLARLTAKVGIIKVGAASEIEANQKKQKIEDALNATRAAIESGIVPGGGVALIRVKSKVNWGSAIVSKPDEAIGVNILLDALTSPFKQLAENAGVGSDVLIKEIIENTNTYYGYDFKNMKFANLKDAGIIDPVKVVIAALQNAASAAGMLITTDVVIVEASEIKEPE